MCRCCGIMTHLRCKKCDTAHYCSEECGSLDWTTHQKICFPSLGERLKAFANLVISEETSKKNLSGFLVLKEFDQRRISPYSYHGANHCAICKKHLGDKQYGENTKPKYLSYKKRLFYYLLCKECDQSGLRLCTDSFTDSQSCWECKMSKICYIMSNREHIFPDFIEDLHHYFLHILYITFQCNLFKSS